MKLSQIKANLKIAETVRFRLENGTEVPDHFHVTEVGVMIKKFIDCGGAVRNEKIVNFQLWHANDLEHRLKPQKLLNIISLSEKLLDIEDLEVEVEYQSQTIGRYDIKFDGKYFILIAKKTNCLAPDQCGVTIEKETIQVSENEKTYCLPNSNCC